MELAGEKDSSDIGDGSSGDDGACGCCGDAEAGWQQPRVGFAALRQRRRHLLRFGHTRARLPSFWSPPTFSSIPLGPNLPPVGCLKPSGVKILDRIQPLGLQHPSASGATGRACALRQLRLRPFLHILVFLGPPALHGRVLQRIGGEEALRREIGHVHSVSEEPVEGVARESQGRTWRRRHHAMNILS